MQWRQRNLPKKVLHIQSFWFANFLVPVVAVIALSLLVVLPRKTILDMRRLYLKTDDLMENARRSTHTEALYRVISAITEFFFRFVFRTPYVETFTLSLENLSKGIHVTRKNKKSSITVTFGHVVHVCRKLPAVKEVGWRADFGKHPIHLLSSRG